MTDPRDTRPAKIAPMAATYLLSVTVPEKTRNHSENHKTPMTEFKIDYQTRRDENGRESVYKVCLPQIPQPLVPAGTSSLPSVTLPMQSQNSPGDRRRRMAEFKIDYQTRRDEKGREFVYRVCLPSTYKGWAFIVEKKNVTSPRAEEVPTVALVSHRHFEN